MKSIWVTQMFSWFLDWKDHSFSFTGCSSFILMQELGYPLCWRETAMLQRQGSKCSPDMNHWLLFEF